MPEVEPGRYTFISSSSAVEPSPKESFLDHGLLRNVANWPSYSSSVQLVKTLYVYGNSIVSDCIKMRLGKGVLCMILACFMVSLALL